MRHSCNGAHICMHMCMMHFYNICMKNRDTKLQNSKQLPKNHPNHINLKPKLQPLPQQFVFLSFFLSQPHMYQKTIPAFHTLPCIHICFTHIFQYHTSCAYTPTPALPDPHPPPPTPHPSCEYLLASADFRMGALDLAKQVLSR